MPRVASTFKPQRFRYCLRTGRRCQSRRVRWMPPPSRCRSTRLRRTAPPTACIRFRFRRATSLETSRARFAASSPSRRARIVSVTPTNRSYVRSVTQIVSELNGASNGSEIEVTGPDNRALVGTASFVGTNLTFSPQPVLATDGRDDGVYTIRVTPINAVGTTGEVGTFTFTLDSQSPEVQSVTQIDMTATESFAKGSVSRITATLSDALAGIDTAASTVGVLAADGGDPVAKRPSRGSSTFRGLRAADRTASIPSPSQRSTARGTAARSRSDSSTTRSLRRC